jgi:hypothetical protein
MHRDGAQREGETQETVAFYGQKYPTCRDATHKYLIYNATPTSLQSDTVTRKKRLGVSGDAAHLSGRLTVDG